jgi:hypothetical protein
MTFEGHESSVWRMWCVLQCRQNPLWDSEIAVSVEDLQVSVTAAVLQAKARVWFASA